MNLSLHSTLPTLARLRTLRRDDWSLLLTAWARLLIVDLELRLLGVEGTARLARAAAGADCSQARIDNARIYARWLRRAAKHHMVRARCLHRSLALHQWLRAGGSPSTMDIGVALDGGQLRAHAWVRIGDQLVSDSSAAVAPFAPLTATAGVPWQ